jgi:hypothetical protein
MHNAGSRPQARFFNTLLLTDLYRQQGALEVAYLFPLGFDMNSLVGAKI